MIFSDVKIYQPEIFTDFRGDLLTIWNGDEFEPKLDYSTLIRLDNITNKFYFKIRLDDKIKIIFNKKKISINELYNYKFSFNDKVRFLLQINSLNLYKNDYKCGIKYQWYIKIC